MLSLDSPVKVGRSVARARPIQTNAIFDCKVNIVIFDCKVNIRYKYSPFINIPFK